VRSWGAEVVIGLQGSGFYPAARIAKKFGPHVTLIGHPISRDADGVRHLDDSIALCPSRIAGRKVLVVDDGVETGGLYTEAKEVVEALRGYFMFAALYGIGDYPRHHQDLWVAKTSLVPPVFFWNEGL
jgi:hypoxanthine phosphoribosyltransferase